MKSIHEFSGRSIKVVFTDIDGTLTHNGRMPEISYSAMWKLYDAGIHIVPVTGRPAGWCEMIARTWPVLAVIGENGGFYFQLKEKNNAAGKVETEMKRVFAPEAAASSNGLHPTLQRIQAEIKTKIPQAKVASDQFSRLLDLAVDFAEDVSPALSEPEIQHIVRIFESHGAHAKVSNIHVNGWLGNYNKRSMVQSFLQAEFQNWTATNIQDRCAFVGDSPNDEPMFEFFSNSFGVKNISQFTAVMTSLPTYVADFNEGRGFAQIAQRILEQSR